MSVRKSVKLSTGETNLSLCFKILMQSEEKDKTNINTQSAICFIQNPNRKEKKIKMCYTESNSRNDLLENSASFISHDVSALAGVKKFCLLRHLKRLKHGITSFSPL